MTFCRGTSRKKALGGKFLQRHLLVRRLKSNISARARPVDALSRVVARSSMHGLIAKRIIAGDGVRGALFGPPDDDALSRFLDKFLNKPIRVLRRLP